MKHGLYAPEIHRLFRRGGPISAFHTGISAPFPLPRAKGVAAPTKGGSPTVKCALPQKQEKVDPAIVTHSRKEHLSKRSERRTDQKEPLMISISEMAREKLLETLKEHGENPALRVYVAGSG